VEYEKFGQFRDAPVIFQAVFGGKAEVAAEAAEQYIAVQNRDAVILPEKILLSAVRQGGFTRPGKAGKPESHAAVRQTRFAHFPADCAARGDQICDAACGLNAHAGPLRSRCGQLRPEAENFSFEITATPASCQRAVQLL
jgi:hypothetical protein